MTEKILFVDDEVNILDSMKRQLRKRFDIHTAESGEAALRIMKESGPFAVIISDMRMPVMDGIQLLAKVKDLYPDTVRMMLTGNADQETAIDAVNRGQIFRFLGKPCPTATLVTSLALALRQYRLVTAEKELLNKTLRGSIGVLSELLSLANPVAFSSGYRVKKLVLELARRMNYEDVWQLEIAALMSQIGCVTLPAEILNKLYAGKELSGEELEMYNSHPKTGANLLEKIPRMESVAGIIARQLDGYSTLKAEAEVNDELTDDITIGAQIIKVAIDYDLLLFQGMRHLRALKELRERTNSYNPEILDKLTDLRIDDTQVRVMSLRVKDIAIGMVVEENIIAKNGALIAPKGQEVTWPVLQGLKNFSRQVGVKEPIRVKLEP